jgi:sphingomyelin phosphodiesterase acid-like 3
MLFFKGRIEMNRACMRHRSGRLFMGFLGVIVLCCVGCSDDASAPRGSAPLLIFSDVHFTPFYDPEIFFDLVNASPDQWPDIFESSAVTQPQSWGKETNYPLFVRTLKAIRGASESGPLVVFPGDILAHRFRETFFRLYGEADETALQSFVYKTCTFFAGQVRAYLSNLPVLFVLGNNDAYAGDYKLIPGGKFLADTTELFYETFLLSGTDADAFSTTYRAGGYYAAQPPSSEVLFICLSTVLFSVHWSSDGHDGAPLQQLDWLAETLADARDEGKRVWILMHVPPGPDVYGTVSAYMDDTGRISDAGMMWKEEYQDRFLEIIRPYSDMIEVCFAGHTHMDEYRIMYYEDRAASEPILISPSVSPQFGNNPGFKVFAVSTPDWELQDYRSMVYPFDLADPEFETYYTFSSAYGLSGPLGQALNQLVPELVSDGARRADYSHFYYSGHDGGNPINDTNWPAYWCATHRLSKEAYMECVNAYPYDATSLRP